MTTSIGFIKSLLVPSIFTDETLFRRDHLPDETEPPFATLSEISYTPELQGDGSTVLGHTEDIQVDIWQMVGAEDLTLLDQVLAALNSKKLAGSHLRCTVDGVARIPEQGVAHDAITVRVARLTPTSP